MLTKKNNNYFSQEDEKDTGLKKNSILSSFASEIGKLVNGNAASGPQGGTAPSGGEQKTLTDMLEDRQKQLNDLDQLHGKSL